VTFAKSRPSAVLVELDPPSAGQTRRTTAFAAAGMAILLAAYAAVGPGAQPTTTPIPVAPAVGSSAPLALPANAADVELIAFPDWLANEPLPASFRAVVAIRGTTGLASVEGRTVVNWTEHGISYRLESIDRSIAELVVLADSLR
jgi:hypothetical protein